jgi:uncharacterized protein
MTGLEIRRLEPGDEALVEAFLTRHAASSLFLRSNMRQSGLIDGETAYHGRWVAGLRDGAVTGIACHAWNGNLVLQAPEDTIAIAEAALDDPRPLAALVGPWEQCERVRIGLAPDRPLRAKLRDILFALDLAELHLPPTLARGVCRRADPADLDLMIDWSIGFDREVFGNPDTETARAETRILKERLIAEGRQFIFEQAGVPVASCTFNAAIPDTVQIGGVWTPPALRAQGYARAVVAGALSMARAAGVRTAVLFTGEDNLAAQRAYIALGFRAIGDYGLMFFEA